MATIRPVYTKDNGFTYLPQAAEWNKRPCRELRTFQDGAIGDIAQNGKDGNTYTDGFDADASRSTYNDEVLFKGRQVCKHFLPQGSVGQLAFGGTVEDRVDVGRYESLWQRVICMFPSSFDFTEADAGGGAMKFLRQTVKDTGHVDIYINSPNNGRPGDFKLNNEVHTSTHDGNPYHTGQHNGNVNLENSVGTLPRDQWFEAHFMVTYDNLPVDEGGHARAMFWIGDTLIEDVTSIHTMNSGFERVKQSMLCTYFNANYNPGQPDHGVTKDMWFWTAEFETTNITPTHTDEFGNPKLPVGL
jgi:hypothetical protein